MTERKIIFKGPIGGSLNGLRKLVQKESYCAVFMPSSKDMFSLYDSVQEQVGSNCLYISLQRFMSLVLTGHFDQIEMLFTPEHMIEVTTPEWEQILSKRNYFITYSTLDPTLKFINSQLENIASTSVTDARRLIQKMNLLSPEKQNLGFADNCIKVMGNDNHLFFQEIQIEYYINEMKETMIKLCGREFNANIRTKTLRDKLRSVEFNSKGRPETDEKHDYNFANLATAFRQVDELEELISRKNITFPRPNLDFLDAVAKGANIDLEWANSLQDKINVISNLRKELDHEVNRRVVDDLYVELISKHFK